MTPSEFVRRFARDSSKEAVDRLYEELWAFAKQECQRNFPYRMNKCDTCDDRPDEFVQAFKMGFHAACSAEHRADCERRLARDRRNAKKRTTRARS